MLPDLGDGPYQSGLASVFFSYLSTPPIQTSSILLPAMASAGMWGAVPQAEALGQDVTRALGNMGDSTLDSETSTDQDEIIIDKEKRDQEVTHLARQFTQHSIRQPDGNYINPFTGSDEPSLDPMSGKFNPEAWTRTLIGLERTSRFGTIESSFCVRLESRDPGRYPKRVAGVSYRNLSVHGFGNLTDYQK